MTERIDQLTKAQLVDEVRRLKADVERLRLAEHSRSVTAAERLAESQRLRDELAAAQSLGARFQDLFLCGPIPYVVLDQGGIIVEANHAAAHLLATPRNHLVGKPFRLSMPLEERARFSEHLRRCRGRRASVATEVRLQPRGRAEIPVELVSEALQTASSQSLDYCTAINDLSMRLYAEQGLRESSELLRLAHTVARLGAWRWDLVSRELHWSESLFDLVGLAPDAVTPTWDRWLRWVAPEHRDAMLDAMRRLELGDEEVQFEFRMTLVADESRWFLFRGEALPEGGGARRRAIGVVSEITPHKQAQRRLLEMNEELQARKAEAEVRTRQAQHLAVELTRAEQRERQRLANVLHDHLQQALIGAKIHTSVLRKALTNSQVEDAANVEAILDQCIEMARSLSVELSPPVLRELGLAAALHWLAGQTQQKHRLLVEVEADEEVEPASEAVRLLLFEASRELLLNVAKHAQVDRVWLRMRRADRGRVTIIVEDRGIGFNVKRLRPSRHAPLSLGLSSVRHRLELLGGSLEIVSALGEGTCATLEAPLSAAGKMR